jgi:mono/diheme cytochrome c family protein
MEWCKRHLSNCYRRFRVKVPVAAAQVLRRPILLVALIIIASSTTAAAQELGSVEAGREYAVHHCASCHAIYGSDTESVNPNAAPFAEIAVTPGMNARALAVWLSSVHNEMPDFIIEKNDMENVIAYILSLAPEQRPQL